jgi:hypothetical protein
MTNEELIEELEQQRSLMVSVATGASSIRDVNDEYRTRRERIRQALAARKTEDPNPYVDLWRFYEKWKADLPSYQSRRVYVSELLDAFIDQVRDLNRNARTDIFAEPTGWAKVDRQLDSVRSRLETASSEEHFQTVGLLCRETLISLAQAVYEPTRHPVVDGSKPSPTDGKRMLEAYIGMEFAGEANEESRRHAKAALDLANALQHRRTATFRTAALCAEATTSVVNLIAIASGLRDPK